jgi:putative ABC transport system permease protein
MRRRVPLVWKNLTHHRQRLLIAVCGVGFAVVLMFTEIGFRNALFDSTVKIFRDLDADVIVASKAYYSLISQETFSRRRIEQARGCPGVGGVFPLYVEMFGAAWKNPDHVAIPIRVLACDPADPVFSNPGIRQCIAALSQPDTAIVDRQSKPKYGFPDAPTELLGLRGAELCSRSVRVVGSFAMGCDFMIDGTVIVSSASLAGYRPLRAWGKDPLSVVDLGIVQVVKGADVRKVIEDLRRILPPDVSIDSKEAFVAREIRFWNDSTPVGYVFFLGVVIGFLVGVVICYQIIYADISDHMAEFATLKAMGYRNRYFIGFILGEALYLSVLSFVPGLLISAAIYQGLARVTGLLMLLTVPRAALVFSLTLAMCTFSGALAMRKVLAADPADLF